MLPKGAIVLVTGRNINAFGTMQLLCSDRTKSSTFVTSGLLLTRNSGRQDTSSLGWQQRLQSLLNSYFYECFNHYFLPLSDPVPLDPETCPAFILCTETKSKLQTFYVLWPSSLGWHMEEERHLNLHADKCHLMLISHKRTCAITPTPLFVKSMLSH